MFQISSYLYGLGSYSYWGSQAPSKDHPDPITLVFHDRKVCQTRTLVRVLQDILCVCVALVLKVQVIVEWCQSSCNLSVYLCQEKQLWPNERVIPST